MKGLMCCLAFLFLALPLFSQSTIKDRFDDPEKVKWVKNYKGRIDDLNDVSVTLAYDGTDYKGELLYLRSKSKFSLDGQEKDGKLSLLEIDYDDQVSGYITGSFISNGFVGKWQNFDKTILGSIQLEKVIEAPEFPTYCGDNKWIRVYKGDFMGNKSELILQLYNFEKVKGSIFFSSDEKTLDVKGSLRNGEFHLDIIGSTGEPKGSLNGQIPKENRLKLNYMDMKGKIMSGLFRVTENLAMGCMEYADYMTAYDFTFPKCKHQALNLWISNKVDEWLNLCREKAGEMKEEISKPFPSYRNAFRGFGWSELSMYSEDIISGSLYFSNTWENIQENEAFNFDMKRGEFIHLEKIFKNGSNYKEIARNFIRLAYTHHPLMEEGGFRNWFEHTEFSIITFRKEGLNFSTGFDPIYGKHDITIPFKTFKNKYQKESIVYRLYKEEG